MKTSKSLDGNGRHVPAAKQTVDRGGQVYDLVCFSHLRWDYVFQRPQHLLSRAATGHRVFYIEEACDATGLPRLEVQTRGDNLWVITPQISFNITGDLRDAVKVRLLAELFAQHGIRQYIVWYYTPAALTFTRQLEPLATVYDCMDELSLFRGAPRHLKRLENELIHHADLVFTGGQSLYEARRNLHPDTHCFPSSIDAAHFGQARGEIAEPADQAVVPRPRLGYFGVIDERMDLDLLDRLAQARSDWHLVMVGPVAKIDEERLPRHPNIHYLGAKAYAELPAYLAGWDVALMPFALNESTRFISPTKTPEYLAGGRPVVSTPVRDVVRPYGEMGMVRIAATPEEFMAAIEAELSSTSGRRNWLCNVDAFLAQSSWDSTWASMTRLIENKLGHRQPYALAEARLRQARAGELLSSEIGF